MSMYIGGSYDVLWALETVYLNKPPSSVLTSRQQMCLLCVCMDQHNTIILLIKALPPLIYTWPQEAMGGCHEEDPLHQELLKPSGDSISRSHDRNVTLSGVLLLNSSREERCKPSSHSLETKGVVPGGWRFLECLDFEISVTVWETKGPTLQTETGGTRCHLECCIRVSIDSASVGPENDFRMVLRRMEKCIFENG